MSARLSKEVFKVTRKFLLSLHLLPVRTVKAVCLIGLLNVLDRALDINFVRLRCVI